jgi:hypothetical protein
MPLLFDSIQRSVLLVLVAWLGLLGLQLLPLPKLFGEVLAPRLYRPTSWLTTLEELLKLLSTLMKPASTVEWPLLSRPLPRGVLQQCSWRRLMLHPRPLEHRWQIS